MRKMSSFKVAFEFAEQGVRSLLEKRGFTLNEVSITEENRSQWIGGVAHYIEKGNWYYPFQRKRFIRLSTAPLRLELDLEIGRGDSTYNIYELKELEGTKEVLARTHDLYEAMLDKKQLKSEFETLIQVLFDCGSRFFSNDSSLWTDLHEQRLRHGDARENEQVFKDAEAAFKKQDWETVVNFLEEKQQDLSNLDLGRLNYAKNKLKST